MVESQRLFLQPPPTHSTGIGTQAMAGASRTPSAAVCLNGAIKCTGVATADYTLTVPAASDAAAVVRDYFNAQTSTTGTWDIIVSTGAGSTVRVALGCTKRLRVDSGGVSDTGELAGPRTAWSTGTASLVTLNAFTPTATTDATITTVETFPIPASSIITFQITVAARRTGGVSGAPGDCYTAEMPVKYQRIGTAAPTLVGAAASAVGVDSVGAGSGYAFSIDVVANGSGYDLRVRFTGLATTNINATALIQAKRTG